MLHNMCIYIYTGGEEKKRHVIHIRGAPCGLGMPSDKAVISLDEISLAVPAPSSTLPMPGRNLPPQHCHLQISPGDHYGPLISTDYYCL